MVNEIFLKGGKSSVSIPALFYDTMSAKQFVYLVLAFACLTAFAGCKTNCPATATAAPPQAHGQKFTYVIVHGAWGGGWDWKHVDDLLTADGNKVYRPTLTGLGEHSNLASTNIDLDTHIQDIVNVILWENLHDIVLVGHSYGGMIITGVADRVPDRIQRVVYIDGLLPDKWRKRVRHCQTGNENANHGWLRDSGVGDQRHPAAARRSAIGQDFHRPHHPDQPGCRRETAHHLHSPGGDGPIAGAGSIFIGFTSGPGRAAGPRTSSKATTRLSARIRTKSSSCSNKRPRYQVTGGRWQVTKAG